MKNGFPTVSLCNVVLPVERPEVPATGTTYRQLGVRLWGAGAYERESIDGSQTKYKTLSRVEANDIVVNKIWARNGSVAIVSNNLAGCYVSGEFPTFIPNCKKLEPRWMHWLTKTKYFWQQCDEKSRGTSGKNRIRPEQFLEVEIPLPTLSEQRRIVAKIESLATKIEEARNLRQKSAEETNALIASFRSNVFSFKSDWVQAQVGDLCEHPQYGYTASASNEPVGPKLLRITDIQNGQVNWGTVPYCLCPNPAPYLLNDNDIVFARTGATTGKSFIINKCPEAIFASYLIRLRVKRLVTSEFLYEYFQSPYYWSQIFDEKKGTGQPNINGQKLTEISISFPKSQDEQNQIVAQIHNFIARLYVVKQQQVKVLSKLNALLPSILSKAFKGEL